MLADITPAHVDATSRELVVVPAIEQVELADRCATQPVDHQRDIVALGVGQVVDDFVCAGELFTARPRGRC
jgi:hypothetical protein